MAAYLNVINNKKIKTRTVLLIENMSSKIYLVTA